MTEHNQPFEELKQSDEQGNEYWSARTLSKLFGYSEFRHFQSVIERAKEACNNSGHKVVDHFEEILVMVKIGSGASREVNDIKLSRNACYLVVQNGDPTKPYITTGQMY